MSMSEVNDRKLSDLDPLLQPLCQQFLDACQAAGISVIITQTYRSSAEQDADYAQGRTLPGKIITNARGGQSPHNCTLSDGTPAARAFDFTIQDANRTLDWNLSDPLWIKAIAIGEGLGLVSGSTFNIKDYDHFQMAAWRENG
jgi:peptidoglycan L-alanyl-D-glutamate endopeptidase CwlK